MEPIAKRLTDKSIEAFLLGIELYNKPTIKYRVEGFSYFICNAWELMLKARLIATEGEVSIYYKDNPDRTISLENCIVKIFTNKKDPLRINLTKILELRNISTHFVTEEYEMVYVPLFQSCVFNYVNKMMDFHNIDLTEHIPQNFLTLSVATVPFDENLVKAKYPEAIAQKLIGLNENIAALSRGSNQNFAIRVEHSYYITKKRGEATAVVGIDNSSPEKVKIVRELKDPNFTHNFTTKKCCEEITRRLLRNGIDIRFNTHHFDLFCKYYGIKENERFCFVNTIHANPTYSYSINAIEFITEEFCKDPENIVVKLKEGVKKR